MIFLSEGTQSHVIHSMCTLDAFLWDNDVARFALHLSLHCIYFSYVL